MLKKETTIIDYLQLERRLHIYLPDDLQKEERLPVFYMFDGHNLFEDEEATFGKSWGLKDYFDAHHVRCIIVGIECNHEGNQRLCEFSPYSFRDREWGKVKATGKQFFEWMVHELKPSIDRCYPTLPDREHTYLGGSSMGGLMAIYGGAMYPHIYSRSACLSPYYDHVFNDLIEDLKSASQLENSIFYLSWGAYEWRTKRTFARGVEENLHVVRILTEKKAMCYPHCYESGTHCEASWEKEIPHFLSDLKIS